MSDLKSQHCKPGAKRLSDDVLRELTPQVSNWRIVSPKGPLSIELRFKSFRAAIDCVNQVAQLAEAQDHHPDLIVRYSRVRIELSTHDAGGLTLNDFILAARISQLLDSCEALLAP